jgi:hypothetical protein
MKRFGHIPMPKIAEGIESEEECFRRITTVVKAVSSEKSESIHVKHLRKELNKLLLAMQELDGPPELKREKGSSSLTIVPK